MTHTRTRIPIDELDPRKALYELQSYQKELEMQNEELEQVRKQNELLIKKYTNLYDQAPSGYLTLDKAGIIQELNLYALTYLYNDRNELINTDFKKFISADTRPIFDEFFQKIFQNIYKSSCDVTLSIHRDNPIYLHIEGIMSDDENNCLLTIVDITILKQMEEALMLSKKEFQSYFENGSVGMSVSSPGKGWIELNQRFCQMLGYTKNELLGINWMDLSHPDDLAANLYLYEQALDGKLDKYQMDKRFIRKDGTILFVTLSVVCRRNADGAVHHLLSSYVDITERELAKEALKESEERFKTIFEDSPDAILLADIKSGLIVDANRAASELLALPTNQIIGMHQSKLLPSRMETKAIVGFQDVINKLKQSIKIQPIQTSVLRSDGVEVPVEIHGNIINVNGKQVGYGVFRDITLRMQAEETLRESENRLREINKTDWVWEVDKNGVYTYTSQTGIDYFGVSKEDIIGKTPFDFMPPDEAKRITAIFSEILTNKAPIKDLENWNIRKNGELFCVLTNGVPIFDKEGNLKGYRGVDKDITDRKLTEQALKESEERFKTIFEDSPDAIILADIKSGIIVDANHAASKLLAKRIDQIIGMHQSKLHSQGIEAQATEDIKEHINRKKPTEKIQPIQTLLLKSDGTEVPVEILAKVIKVNGKHVIHEVFRDLTVRKRAEEKLNASEIKFRSLFEHMVEGFAFCRMLCENGKSTDFIFLDVNPSFEKLTGLKNVAGKKVSEVIPGILKSDLKLFKAYDRVALTGRPERFETYVEVLNKWFHISLYSPDKEHFVAIFEDINDRKLAEKALQNSEEQFRNLYENAPIGIYRTKPDGKIITANSVLVKMLGFDSLHELQQRDLRIENDYDPQYSRAKFQTTIESEGKVRSIESAWKHKDGTFIQIRENAVVVKDEFGNSLYYDGTLENFTEQMLEEKALKESNERFKVLFEGSPDSIILADIETGLIIDANHSVSDLLLIPIENIRGLHYSKLQPKRLEASRMNVIQQYINKIKQSDKTPPCETLLIRSDGIEVPIELLAKIITLNGKETIQAVFRDITKRKQAEAELHESEHRYRMIVENGN